MKFDRDSIMRIFDGHLHKKLTVKLARVLTDEILVAAGVVIKKKNRKRTCTVAMPNPDGTTRPVQVKPSKYGSIPTENQVYKDLVIGHPSADD